MAYTYSGDPSASDKDFVRFKIQDVDVAGGANSADFTDEEIAATLAATSSKYQAAYLLARARLQKFTRLAMNAGSDQLNSIVTAGNQAVQMILDEAAQQGVPISMAAESISARQLLTQDADRVQPRFFRGQHDFSPAFQTFDDGDGLI